MAESPDAATMDSPAPSTSRARLSGLSVIFPSFNEGATLVEAVAQARRLADRVSERPDIITVDDGSTDDTAGVARGLVEDADDVRLVLHPEKRGYGAAVRSGIQASAMAWIFLTDPHLRFDLADFEEFLPFVADSDLIVGRRIIRRQALASRIDGAAWNWLVRRLFDLPVGDVDCAFKLMRRDLVAELELVSDGRTINTELVAKSLLAGGRITEVGVRQLGEARSPASAGGLIADVRELLQLRGARQAGRLAPPER